MANDFSINIPALQLNGQTIPSGMHFDLEMPNLSDLINQSFAFAQQNNAGNQAFLENTITQSQQFIPQVAAIATPVFQQEAQMAQYNASASIVAEQTAANNSGGMCFVTTALCEYEGKADNCIELETLREFRDTYMQETDERKWLVNVYYAVAPIIVSRLNKLNPDHRDSVYAHIRDFIDHACMLIRIGRFETARACYQAMLEFAASEVRYE